MLILFIRRHLHISTSSTLYSINKIFRRNPLSSFPLCQLVKEIGGRIQEPGAPHVSLLAEAVSRYSVPIVKVGAKS